MLLKRPPLPERLRSRPVYGFGWIDHRFLRDGYLSRASPSALALYCLLVCAADRDGLSYYSAERLCSLLVVDTDTLASARCELIELGLIAYRKPLYQLLSLDAPPLPLPPPPSPAAPASPRRSVESHAPVRNEKKTPAPPSSPQPAAAARGLDLRAMVEARLRTGAGEAGGGEG